MKAALPAICTGLLATFACALAGAQSAGAPSTPKDIAAQPAPSSSRYEFRDAHDPDGIGKIYMGREIARVMGPGGIVWLERPERAEEEQPERMLVALQIRPGQTVADLGAGSGYHTFMVADLVGATGKVLAVDIQPDMLEFIAQRARREGVTNIETVRASERDPNLPPQSVDLLFMVDVYHELAFPYEQMKAVHKALKSNGRVALIEYRAEDPAVLIKPEHEMSEAQIVRELEAAGFRHVQTVRTLPLQHLVLFEKR